MRIEKENLFWFRTPVNSFVTHLKPEESSCSESAVLCRDVPPRRDHVRATEAVGTRQEADLGKPPGTSPRGASSLLVNSQNWPAGSSRSPTGLFGVERDLLRWYEGSAESSRETELKEKCGLGSFMITWQGFHCTGLSSLYGWCRLFLLPQSAAQKPFLKRQFTL